MALTDENGGNGFYMPVAPAYGGGNGFGGFGGDGWWIILLLLAFNGGGWGMNGWGGMMGGFGGMYEFPWLLNGQNMINANTNAGFDHAATQAALGDLNNAVNTGFGNVATQLCGGFAGVNAAITNAEMNNMQNIFGVQSALQNCCCENRANIADLKFTVAQENCADRAAVSDGIRDLLAATQAQTQTILTQLCNDKIEQKNDTINQLRQELLYARGQASQDVQTATLRAGQVAEVDALYNRLSQCPVNTIPVYGSQPVFTCGGGCGCNG